MRTHRPALLTSVAVLLAASTAAADVSGTYDVKYEEVSTNCQSPLRYPHGKLTVTTKGTTIKVDIDRTPLMQGSVTRGKISAKSKKGATMIDGMSGVFSVAGKITPEGMLSLVMIGEFSAGGRPLCSQSWNVAGSKADAAPAPAEPPAKKKKSSEPFEPLALFTLPSLLM